MSDIAEIHLTVEGPMSDDWKSYMVATRFVFKKSIKELVKLVTLRRLYGGFFEVRIRWYSDKYIQRTGDKTP